MKYLVLTLLFLASIAQASDKGSCVLKSKIKMKCYTDDNTGSCLTHFSSAGMTGPTDAFISSKTIESLLTDVTLEGCIQTAKSTTQGEQKLSMVSNAGVTWKTKKVFYVFIPSNVSGIKTGSIRREH